MVNIKNEESGVSLLTACSDTEPNEPSLAGLRAQIAVLTASLNESSKILYRKTLRNILKTNNCNRRKDTPSTSDSLLAATTLRHVKLNTQPTPISTLSTPYDTSRRNHIMGSKSHSLHCHHVPLPHFPLGYSALGRIHKLLRLRYFQQSHVLHSCYNLYLEHLYNDPRLRHEGETWAMAICGSCLGK